MLDPRDPKTEHVLRASAIEDRIRAHLVAIRRDADGTDTAWRYREIAQGIIPELHGLNDGHFGSSDGIASQLDALRAAAVEQDIERSWTLFIALAESPGDNFGTWAI